LYSTLLADSTFHDLLLAYDRDLADGRRQAGCACGGVLHSAKYPRKPRPWAVVRRLRPEHGSRFSFCCAIDGCRSQATPPSLRFLGRKVFLATIVTVISIMRHGVSEPRMRRLAQSLNVDRRTIARWRGWWREAFTAMPFWQIARASFMPPVDESRFPATLIERFAGIGAAERMIALLRFLSPVTGVQAQVK
jgi:hypothetical protein